MIIVTVKSTPKPEYAKDYVKAVNEITPSVRQEKGCIEYELYQLTEETNQFLLFERWETREDLDRHLKSSQMEAFKAKANAFFSSERIIRVYTINE